MRSSFCRWRVIFIVSRVGFGVYRGFPDCMLSSQRNISVFLGRIEVALACEHFKRLPWIFHG